jgi:hypothetical protein
MAVKRGGFTPQEQARLDEQRDLQMARLEEDRLTGPMSVSEEARVAAATEADIAATPGLLDMPTEELSARMRSSPQGFVGDPGRTIQPLTRVDEMEAAIAEQGPNAIAAALTGTPAPDQFGRMQPRTEEQAQAQVKAALQQSSAMAPLNTGMQPGQELTPKTPFMSTTGAELQAEVRQMLPGQRTTRGSADSYNKIVRLGSLMGDAFSRQAGATLQATDEVSLGLQQALINGGLYDQQTNQITPRFNNIAAFTLLEMLQNELLVKNTLAVEGYDPNSSSDVEDLSEFENIFDLDEEADIADVRTKGAVINPALARMDPTAIMFDKALPNPNQVGDAYTAYGGGSTALSEDTRTAFKYLYYTALQDLGYLEERPDGKGYQMSETAIEYFFKSRDVLTDILPNLDQLPSLVENVEGQTFGAERGRGFKKSGNVSTKTARPYGDNLELETMDIQGRIQHRINDPMFAVAQQTVGSLINGRMLDNGKVILNKRKPLNEMAEDKFASTSPFAVRIGMDEGTWQRHYINARVNGQEHADAVDQADAIMASKARRLVKEMTYGVQLSGMTLYVRKLYAASTSRFYDRNTIVSPQANKIVRNYLGPAEPTLIDVRENNEAHRIWKYMIGRALINTQDLAPISAKYENSVTVEDMGFNETLRVAEEKIFGERYNGLVKLARAVRDIINNPTKEVNLELQRTFADLGTGMGLANKLNDPEEWGFVLQALLDLAEYDNHKLAAALGDPTIEMRSGTPEVVSTLPVNQAGDLMTPRAVQLQQLLQDAMLNEDQDAMRTIQADLEKEIMDTKVKYPKEKTYGPVFRPKLLGKFDGKSSGQAIQGALFGNPDVMSRTGVMFESFENVVPFGTIRTQFLDRIVPRKPTEKSILLGIFNKEDEKLTFWTSFFERMMEGENRKLLETSLAKKPIMETSYEKSTMFQHKSAREISYNFNLEKQLQDMFGGRYPLKEAILDLNEIIKATLEETLSLDNQKLMRDIGQVWGLLLNRKARFITPTGKTIALGSRNRVETDQSITFPTATGETTVPIFKSVYTSTDTTKKVPKQYNPEKMHFEAGGTTRYTQEVANQLPVLIIQSVDAAIMAMTFASVNRGRQVPLYAIDIHDALMLDVKSYKAYHTAYNRIFEELTSPTSVNQYRVWDSIRIPMMQELDEIRKELAGNTTNMEVNFDNMETRGIHQILFDFEQMRLGNQIGPDYTRDFGTGATGSKGTHKSKNTALSILKLAKEHGWTPEGGTMRSDKVGRIIAEIINNYMMMGKRLKSAQDEAQDNAFTFARNRKNITSLNLN